MAGLLEYLSGRPEVYDDYRESPDAYAKRTLLDPDIVTRGSMLPIGKDKSGDIRFAAPEFAIDALKAFNLPSHAMRGGSYEVDDAVNASLEQMGGGLLSSKAIPNAVPSGDVLGAYSVVPPSEFVIKAGNIIDQMPLEQQVLTAKPDYDYIQNVNRMHDGSLNVGTSGVDVGNAYGVYPNKARNANELATVIVSPPNQGKGAGRKIAEEAVRRNKLQSNKPMFVEAFENIPEMRGGEGVDNSAYWRGLGFDKEIDKYNFDPDMASQQYLDAGYSPADIQVLEYTGGLLGDSKSAGFKPQDWQPWNSQLFDVAGMNRFDRYPDVPQEAILRNRPVRGLTPRMEAMLSDPRSIDRQMDLYGIGQQKGGDAWYNTRPLLDEAIDMFGEELGTQYWRDTMGVSSAMSPQTKVREELIRSSFIRNFQKEHGRMPEKGEVPEGKGGLGAVSLFSSMIPMARDFQSGAGIGGGMLGKADKVRSYAENKLGNMAPSTGDVHMERIMMSPYTNVKNRLGKPSELQEKFSDREYGAFEDRMDEIAQQVGAGGGGMVQPNIWVGGSGITGVADHRPFLQLYENEVMNTANMTGQNPRDVLRGILSGEQYFLK
jgi:hypothetical protein